MVGRLGSGGHAAGSGQWLGDAVDLGVDTVDDPGLVPDLDAHRHHEDRMHQFEETACPVGQRVERELVAVPSAGFG